MEFRRAKEELQAARAALVTIENEPGPAEMRRAWQELIDRLEKTWKKFKLECEQKGSRATAGAASTLRRTDPLLRYLTQARNADQHTLQSSTMFGLGMRIALPPGAELHLDLLKQTATANGGDVLIQTTKPKYCLLPVTNRGVTFEPPTVHLGRALPDATPCVVARLAFQFYEGLITKSESVESA